MNRLPSADRRFSFPILEVVGLIMIILATVLFLNQMGTYSEQRQSIPQGLTLGEVPVGGLSNAEAQARLEQVYGEPVAVYYNDELIYLDPNTVSFVIDSPAMLSRADELRTEGTFWVGFWDYLWGRPEQTYKVDLIATYTPELLRSWVADIATRYDSPPQPTQVRLETLSYEEGSPGYTLDQEASIQLIDAALDNPNNRVVHLPIIEEEAPRPGMSNLGELLTSYLDAEQFEGVASLHVIDLENGDELSLNIDLRGENPTPLDCDIAYAGTSQMKIAIMVDYFRYLDWIPTEGSDDYKILFETMTLSGNISANFMLQNIGYDNLYAGVEDVTDTIQLLGLENSFIVAPYDDEDPPKYYSTPAREAARNGDCINSRPDPYMQTTVDDMAEILDMIYKCATFDGGGLKAAFPDEFTQEECQMMLELMSQNDEGVLIMAGVPPDVEVAHKHGWISDTHGDAGIVFSPGGDYVLTVFLWADVDWLYYEYSFPLIAGLSEATFNYFNPDLIYEPRLGLSGF